jgi:hypothetical protein
VSFTEDGPDEDEAPDFEDLEVVKDARQASGYPEPVWCAAALEMLGSSATDPRERRRPLGNASPWAIPQRRTVAPARYDLGLRSGT